MALNKGILIENIAENHGLTKAGAGRIVNEIFDSIVDEVAENGEVAIAGFGTFKKAQSAEREGRNPSTGESITIPAKMRVKFSASKNFKEKVQ